MPQMAPYNWLILFLLFNMIMIIIASFTHFTFSTPPIKKSSINLKNNNLDYQWKW